MSTVEKTLSRSNEMLPVIDAKDGEGAGEKETRHVPMRKTSVDGRELGNTGTVGIRA